MNGDTIAAVATAPGRAGVAVVRVSGPEAFAVAEKLTGRAVIPGRIAFRRLHSSDGKAHILDEAVVLSFRGPRSYTGEDVVEFQCHGGEVTPRRVLEACFAAGARLARRGEFTERAFLNGRLDYDQAESVLDLVNAKTVRAADAALDGLTGRRERAYRALYDEALSLSTELEHALDIDEGELPEDFEAVTGRRIEKLDAAIRTAIVSAREGKMLREGALVVLAGPPNAGKSSLMNALLGENRAIVSAVPGTTRDSIEEWLDLDGYPVRLVDTAGLRETRDEVEAEGVSRAEALVAKADFVLSLGQDENTGGQGDGRIIRLHAKCDLNGPGQGGDMPRHDGDGRLRVSAKTGEGLDALRAELVGRLAAFEPAEEPHGVDLLLEASRQLGTAVTDDPVLAANAVRSCAETLGRLIGAVYSADLLDSLFSRFCVGK